MASARYAVEVTTVQGAALSFGPYPQGEAERVAAEFTPHIGRDEMVFSSATDATGRPAGAWALDARGIARVRVIPCPSRASGRLQRPRWSPR
jgi:hypothetical protein